MREVGSRVRLAGAFALTIALSCLFTALAVAAETATETVVRSSAPVKVANRTVIRLWGPVAGYTAEERAKATMDRIEKALELGDNPTITLEEATDLSATRVLLNGSHAFLVTQIDIDRGAGETTKIVAGEAVKRLKIAMGERREQRTPRYLAFAAASSAVATALFGLIVWFLFRSNRWIGHRLSAAAEGQVQKLHVGGVRLLDRWHVLDITQKLLTLLIWVIAIMFATAWLTFVLERFPYTRPWGEGLEGNLLGVVKHVALAIVHAMPGLLLVVIIFVLARSVNRVAAVFFDRVARGRLQIGWLDEDTAEPTKRILAFVVYVFALAMAYPYLPGAGTEAFKGLSVLVGVMVSLGGASVVGQAFSGLILMYMKSFRKGDFVRIGDVEGTVAEVGLFATRIRTGLGEEVTLPNSGIMATTAKNYSRAVPGTGYVVDTVVTIGYGTPWRQVEAMLVEAAVGTPGIAKDPAPLVRQTALSDYYVEYRLMAYTPVETPRQRIEVLSDMHSRIQDVFNEHGVQIMSPHYMMDPKDPQVVPKDKWHLPPARPPGEG